MLLGCKGKSYLIVEWKRGGWRRARICFMYLWCMPSLLTEIFRCFWWTWFWSCHGTFQLLSCLCPSTLCRVQMKAVSSTTIFIASSSFLKFVRVYTTATSCLAWHIGSCYSTCKFSLFYFLSEYLLMFRLQRRRRFWLDVTSLKFWRVYHGHHLARELQQKRYWGHYHHLSSDRHGYKSWISRGMGTGTRICTPTKAVPVRRGLRFWAMYPFAAHNFRAIFQVSFII